jgi:hypothetical protein
MRKIPDSLLNLQQRQREQTISTIKSAIQELQAEGYPITIKRLCERTGLSRSVFNKPHVKALLDEELSNCPAKAIHEGTLEKQCAKLLLQLEKSKRREIDLKLANMQLRETVQELRSECEMLRGELHSLMQHEIRLQAGGDRK